MTAINYTTNTVEIANQLKGATVRYLANKSNVTKDNVRIFKIQDVAHVGFSKKDNRLFATVQCLDFDDNLETRYRTLQIAGIELIA